MRELHKKYYPLCVLVYFMIGIYKGKEFYHYSDTKEKWIRGEVKAINGNSVTDDIFEIDAHIVFDEPSQGYDYNYYIQGWYDVKSIRKMLKEKPELSKQQLDSARRKPQVDVSILEGFINNTIQNITI